MSIFSSSDDDSLADAAAASGSYPAVTNVFQYVRIDIIDFGSIMAGIFAIIVILFLYNLLNIIICCIIESINKYVLRSNGTAVSDNSSIGATDRVDTNRAVRICGTNSRHIPFEQRGRALKLRNQSIARMGRGLARAAESIEWATSGRVNTAGDTLHASQYFMNGDFITSQNGRYQFGLEETGQLTLRDLNDFAYGPIWSRGSAGNPSFAVLQADANLCLKSGTPDQPGDLVWHSAADGGSVGPASSGWVLVVQNDRNVVIYFPGASGIVWQSRTSDLSYIKANVNKNNAIVAAGEKTNGAVKTVSAKLASLWPF